MDTNSTVHFSVRIHREILQPIYSEEERTIICSEVLHAIVSHEHPRKPLTVEAGIVRIADALDMEKGRARVPFQAGKVDIHTVSALSIEKVGIQEGEGALSRLLLYGRLFICTTELYIAIF